MAIAALLVGTAVLVYVYHPRFDTVLTGSMRPEIQPGDVVMVRAVPTDELKAGDVIAYLPPAHTTPVLHRIVSIDSSGLVTKGDANNVADPWGKVGTDSATTLRLVWVIPKVGLIAHNRSTVFIGAGALLIAATALTVLTHKRREKEDGDADTAEGGTSEIANRSPAEGGSDAVRRDVQGTEVWSQNAALNDGKAAGAANDPSNTGSDDIASFSITNNTLTTTTER
jgi:signal peptidase